MSKWFSEQACYGGRIGTALTALLGAVACSAPSGSEPSTGSNPAATLSEPVAPPAARAHDLTARAVADQISWYRWTKGDPPLNMKPWRTHICGFGMIRGDFRNNTTSLFMAPVGDNWVLRATNTSSNLMQADGLCLPLSAFSTNSGSATLGQVVSAGMNSSTKNRTVTTFMPTNTAPILTSVTGAFNGFGEEAWVDTSFQPSVNMRNGTASGTHSAGAFPLSFGAQRPVNYSPGFYLLQSDSEFGACEPDCPSAQFLNSTFCVINSISGKMRGADEWAQVYPDFASGQWKVSVHAGSGSSIEANVECVDIGQSTSDPPGGPVH